MSFGISFDVATSHAGTLYDAGHNTDPSVGSESMASMLKEFGATTVALACLYAPIQAASAKGTRGYDPRTDANLGDATRAIHRLIGDTHPRPRGIQHFCAVAYRGPEGTSAWVHWREAHRLFFWSGQADADIPDGSLVFSHRKLDLDRDVVATEAEVGSSTYLVTRAWVTGVLADCQAAGAHYVVNGK